MQEFKDKVAVITGAASGIGRGIAERCAQEGMQVVLADIEPAALRLAEQELRSAGATALAVLTNVSKAGDVKALAQKTLDTFGAVHLTHPEFKPALQTRMENILQEHNPTEGDN